MQNTPTSSDSSPKVVALVVGSEKSPTVVPSFPSTEVVAKDMLSAVFVTISVSTISTATGVSGRSLPRHNTVTHFASSS